jgi:hypothetical protein
VTTNTSSQFSIGTYLLTPAVTYSSTSIIRRPLIVISLKAPASTISSALVQIAAPSPTKAAAIPNKTAAKPTDDPLSRI